MKLKKVGFIVLAVLICLSLVGCKGGVQRFVGGKDKGQVQIDKLVRQLEEQVARIEIKTLKNSKTEDDCSEIKINELAGALKATESLNLETEAKKVKDLKPKGNSKNKKFQANEEKISFNNGLQLAVTLKNGKTFTVKLNDSGAILVIASKGEEYLFSGGEKLYQFLIDGKWDSADRDKKYADFSFLDEAKTLKVLYRNDQGEETQSDSVNLSYLKSWTVKNLVRMRLYNVGESFAFAPDKPYFRFTFGLEDGSQKEIIIQDNLARYDGKVYKMSLSTNFNCFRWLEQSWNQFLKGDKRDFYYLYNADRVEMTCLTDFEFPQGVYSSVQLPGLKNWALNSVLDLPLQKLSKTPTLPAYLQKQFNFSFTVNGENIFLNVFDRYVVYNNNYYQVSGDKTAYELMEEAWKEFAPPYYGSDKTKLALIGRADQVTVRDRTQEQQVSYSGTRVKNWAIHSLLSLELEKTAQFSLPEDTEHFIIDYQLGGESFKAVIFEEKLLLTVGSANYYYQIKGTGAFNAFHQSWDELLNFPNRDFVVLHKATETQMRYRDVSNYEGIYNSNQLPYFTPWAVHSILSLDLVETTAPVLIEQPRFEFSFKLGEEKIKIFIHKNYVNYDGTWYRTRDDGSPFKLIENSWKTVLKN